MSFFFSNLFRKMFKGCNRADIVLGICWGWWDEENDSAEMRAVEGKKGERLYQVGDSHIALQRVVHYLQKCTFMAMRIHTKNKT
jgi:hypothetical protein